MTREEAKEFAEVIMHYANGGEVEYLSDLTGTWEPNDNPGFISSPRKYRKAPGKKYRPFTQEELQRQIGKAVRRKENLSTHLIFSIDGNYITVGTLGRYSSESAFSMFVKTDGTPFGMLEE